METAKKYQLKSEFSDLFSNLATGEKFWQKDTFNKPGVPVRKSYADEAEANHHYEILKKLIDAGFIDVIDTGITAKEK